MTPRRLATDLNRRLPGVAWAFAAILVGIAAPAGAADPKPATATKSKASRPKPRTSVPPAPGAPAEVINAFEDLPLPPMPDEAEAPDPAAAVPATPAQPAAPWLVLFASTGVALPSSVLGPGPSATLGAELRPLEGTPLVARLSLGFERHRGSAARQFPAPGGGSDPAALETQTLLPLRLGADFEAWRADAGAITIGASYGLVPTWTRVEALGRAHPESGLGHEFRFEAGYTRSLGAVTLLVRGGWALRRTAVGPYTQAVELPWYQAATLGVGLGVPL